MMNERRVSLRRVAAFRECGETLDGGALAFAQPSVALVPQVGKSETKLLCVRLPRGEGEEAEEKGGESKAGRREVQGNNGNQKKEEWRERDRARRRRKKKGENFLRPLSLGLRPSTPLSLYLSLSPPASLFIVSCYPFCKSLFLSPRVFSLSLSSYHYCISRENQGIEKEETYSSFFSLTSLSLGLFFFACDPSLSLSLFSFSLSLSLSLSLSRLPPATFFLPHSRRIAPPALGLVAKTHSSRSTSAPITPAALLGS